jgi:hypothetical protein
MVLRDTGRGLYEPVPFHRATWTGHPRYGESAAAEQARLEAEIKAAVARLAARVEEQ